ncbi:MAG TPA: GAF domain-containing protein [Solirubrobacteraceae bacterium]|nr:GAF domain-containing protein [Solirubrobacteraceae bacterium]
MSICRNASPWLALDAGGEWRTLACSVARARADVLMGQEPAQPVREVIRRSWQRSCSTGVDPDHATAPSVMSANEASARWEQHPLREAEPLLRDLFDELVYDTRQLVLICDRDGSVIWRYGHPQTLQDAVGMHADLGSNWSERSVGTNAIGTALAERHPLQVFSTEHFAEWVHGWTCSAAPVRDPLTREVVGVIDLSGLADTAHPHSLGFVAAAARLAESQLVRSAPVPAGTTVELHLLRGEYPTLISAGGPRMLSVRHAELLALLAIRPEGWSAEALAIALYGERGKSVTVRSEVSRLRQCVGPIVQTRPYRLADSVRSDIVELQRLLEDDRLHASLELYRGQFVSRSELPLIVEWRHWLDGQLRSAVLRCNDPTAIERYLRCGEGHDDEQAMDRLLDLLAPADPRSEALRRHRTPAPGPLVEHGCRSAR